MPRRSVDGPRIAAWRGDTRRAGREANPQSPNEGCAASTSIVIARSRSIAGDVRTIRRNEWQPRAPAGWIGCSTFDTLFAVGHRRTEQRDENARGLVMKMRPTGVIPPMTTPFTRDGEIDFKLVAPQVDWLIGAGSHGMAAGGSTGEGHTLDHEEYRDLIAATVEAARGRAPVIAGIIVDSTRDAIRRGKLVRDMDVAALQVTPVHYLFKPDEQAMVDHFRRMADETGMPIIIYNVVPWSYLSPALLTRIMTEVPLVVGVKQSAGDLKLFADLMMMAPDKLIYSAVDALMYPSYTLGAHGSIAAILTAAPHASVALWDAVKAGNHPLALELHKKLLTLWNAIIADNLPACTRFAQTLQGLPKTYPRAPMPEASPAQQAAIRSALAGLGVVGAREAAE
jgi:4-hydroxy-tetrahydrodipicolinate synthase